MTSTRETKVEGGTPSPPDGFSQFVTKVLDQLSLSSWLPAALFVGSAAVILEVYAQNRVDVLAALISLTERSFGLLIVAVFALVLAAMLLQAFELAAIRVLEGYWPSIASSVGLAGLMVRIQAGRQARALRRVRRLRIKAFGVAREKMLDAEDDVRIINHHKRTVLGEPTPDGTPPEIILEAQNNPWEELAEPQMLRAVEAAERAAGLYPEPHRTMPTRLGNALRSAEDNIKNGDGGPLRTFVIRNWHLLPTEIQELHDQYRNRLDLYCSLVFVCGLLALGGGVLFLTKGSHLSAAIAAATFFGVCALVSYRAAITSAEGYGGALSAIDDWVGRERS